jgi:hypothetical protein
VPSLLKHVNYVIQPSNARPAKIVRNAASGDLYDFDLDQVELTALRETLQTTLGANPFSSFIRGFLAPYTDWLIWLGQGPGIGREMRRSFSALFGRFFARAYLNDCHGLVWFVPLDGPAQLITPRLRVTSGGPRQDLPDWICAGRGHLALAEAKGAKGNTQLSHQSQPAQIRRAVRQLQNCRVEVLNQATRRWVARKLKGWAVLNQWCVQTSNAHNPYIYVVDPETDGEALSSDDLPAFIRAVAREHVAGLFRGLRLYSLASSISVLPLSLATEVTSFFLEPSHVTVSVAALDHVTAIGRFFSLEAGEMVSWMFGEDIFVGVQSEVFEDLSASTDAAPIILQPHTAEALVRGADGLILARQSAVERLS